MLLTADTELYHNIPDVKKDIDFCFVGSLTWGANHAGRRRMVDLLNGAGFKVLALSDVYDISKIVHVYNRSKVILNHATDVGQPFGSGYGYQCRHFEAGFTKACLLSNTVINDDSSLNNFFRFSDEHSLIKMAKFLILHEDQREGMAQLLYDELNVSHRPEHRAQEMVDFIGTL
jgi:spore maturation protein CgeB